MDNINNDEKLRAIEIEIKRTKNKIKFMEKQLTQLNNGPWFRDDTCLLIDI